MELLVRLLNAHPQGATLNLAVMGCSKGAEVYSISYAIRSARPDLNVNLHALDILKAVVQFAEAGVYSLKTNDGWQGGDGDKNPLGVQYSSIFERLSPKEMEALFDRAGDNVRV